MKRAPGESDPEEKKERGLGKNMGGGGKSRIDNS